MFCPVGIVPTLNVTYDSIFTVTCCLGSHPTTNVEIRTNLKF